MFKLLAFIFGWFLAPFVRRRAIHKAARLHDAYAHERVHARKRPGFDTGQREVAIMQRAQRDLHRTGVKVTMRHVKKILEG